MATAGKVAHGSAQAVTLQVRSAGCAGIELLRDSLKVLASGSQFSLVDGIISVGNLRAEFSECIRQQISKFTCLFVIQSQFHVRSPDRRG